MLHSHKIYNQISVTDYEVIYSPVIVILSTPLTMQNNCILFDMHQEVSLQVMSQMHQGI